MFFFIPAPPLLGLRDMRKSEYLALEGLVTVTDWFLVENGGMGFWDYYRGP